MSQQGGFARLPRADNRQAGKGGKYAWEKFLYGPLDEIEKKWWTIPAARIKTRNHRQEGHRVYLTPLALRLIGKNTGSSCRVFPGSSLDAPIQRSALSHMICDKRAGGRPAGNGRKTESMGVYLGLPRWTPHDLRRTAATKLSELGCPDEIIDAILNHAKQGVIGVYNRNKYDTEKRNGSRNGRCT
jgi:integrase